MNARAHRSQPACTSHDGSLQHKKPHARRAVKDLRLLEQRLDRAPARFVRFHDAAEDELNVVDMSRSAVPARLLERTRPSIDESLALAGRWNGAAGGRLRAAFAPRSLAIITL